jgi:hypothetical protein
VREDLRLVFQPPKCPRVHHPIAVALKIIAVRVPGLKMPPSTRAFERHREARQ